jgi:hypothetical protein
LLAAVRAVRVDEQVGFVSDHLARMADPCRVAVRLGADLHLHRRDALLDPAGELALDLFRRVGGEAAATIHRHSLAQPPEQRGQSQAEQPCLQVPQRDVYCRDRARGDSWVADVSHRAARLRPRRRRRPRVCSHHRIGKQLGYQRCGGARCIAIAKSDVSGGACFHDHERRGIPAQGAVCLGHIGGDGEGSRHELLNDGPIPARGGGGEAVGVCAIHWPARLFNLAQPHRERRLRPARRLPQCVKGASARLRIVTEQLAVVGVDLL